MKKFRYKTAFILAVSICLFACSDLDEFNPAASDLTNPSSFDALKARQTVCYAGIKAGTGLMDISYFALAELGTDLWVPASSALGVTTYDMNYTQLSTSSSWVRSTFAAAYSQINTCNTVISRGPKVIAANPDKADAVKVMVAEARCLRAYYYYVLCSQFGSITLYTEELTVPDLNPKRTPVSELYAQMVTDLKAAASDLGVVPYEGNYARCTKKTALGLLARVYAQGAGEGLTEDGVSYWQKAKDVAEDLIKNMSSYGAYMYDDIDDMWANNNNRNNKEALFIASGRDGTDAAQGVYGVGTTILTYFFGPINEIAGIKTNGGTGLEYFNGTNGNNNIAGYYYGRQNQFSIAPSKYLIDCFDADHDRRWDNTFVTAFSTFTLTGAGADANYNNFAKRTLTLTSQMCTTYGIDQSFVGSKIYPYADLKYTSTTYRPQFTGEVWPKGNTTGNPASTLKVKNIYVHPYPLAEDENRFFVYLSKKHLTTDEKKKRGYFCVNIDDLFDGTSYKTATFDGTTSWKLHPAFMKYNPLYYGVNIGNPLYRTIDFTIMRMAEVYLIAAEANVMLNKDLDKAKDYINVLRKRAYRSDGVTSFDNSTFKLNTNPTMTDIYDEYARELCGEFGRWALLKRHKAIKQRLDLYNTAAGANFTDKYYLRPISSDFLNQISNAGEYGTNGY